MNYWLMKSEPNCYSIDDLKRDKKTSWTGVRNYQVRNMMRDQMQPGDLAFFYYSNAQPSGIAGVMEIASKAYADPTAFDPEDDHYDPRTSPEKPAWLTVDVKFKQKFPRVLALEDIRGSPDLNDLLILRKGSRLSVTPLTKTQYDTILKII